MEKQQKVIQRALAAANEMFANHTLGIFLLMVALAIPTSIGLVRLLF